MSPGEILASRREEDVTRYLLVREALLAVPGVTERVVSDGQGWALAFGIEDREFLRARLASRRARAGRLGLALTAPSGMLEALTAANDLASGTRRRLHRAARRRTACTLPIENDDVLTEAIGLALTLATRLAATV